MDPAPARGMVSMALRLSLPDLSLGWVFAGLWGRAVLWGSRDFLPDARLSGGGGVLAFPDALDMLSSIAGPNAAKAHCRKRIDDHDDSVGVPVGHSG